MIQQIYYTSDFHGDEDEAVNDLVRNTGKRKPHYEEGEALEVAMAWVAQLEGHTNRKGETF